MSIDHTRLTKLFLEDNFIISDSGEGQNVSKKCRLSGIFRDTEPEL